MALRDRSLRLFVRAAVLAAMFVIFLPLLAVCYWSEQAGTPGLAELGADEIALTRAAIGWPHPPFEVPAEVYADWDAKAKGQAAEQRWHDTFATYQKAHPALAAEFQRRMAGDLPKHFHQTVLDAVVAALDDPATCAAAVTSIPSGDSS